MKKCPRCGKVLPDNMFAPHTRHCKLCRRDYDWQYNYGISPDEYYTLWQKQKGKCKICGLKMPDGEYLHVDHDKKTGKIRGLLCRRCNLGLGYFKDNSNILKNASLYLEQQE